MDEEIKEKRPELATRKGVIFHQDNTRPHTSLVTRKKLLELGWEMTPHPPYSSDHAPSDYHLFRSLQNCMAWHGMEPESGVSHGISMKPGHLLVY